MIYTKINKTILFLLFMYSSGTFFAQTIGFKDLKPLLRKQSDTTYVINFWATWCGPCVKELPHIEEIGKKYKDEKLTIIYVSLDFVKNYETKLLPFLEKNKLSHKVYLLDEPDPNSWIDSVDKSWQGSIPATLIYNNKKREFFERSFDYETLDSIIVSFIKP